MDHLQNTGNAIIKMSEKNHNETYMQRELMNPSLNVDEPSNLKVEWQ